MNFGEAVGHLEKALLLKDCYGDAHMNLGRVMMYEGHSTIALQHFSKSISCDPSNAAFHFERGVALGKLGMYSDAESGYNRALELDPNHHEALLNLAALFHQNYQLQEAIHRYKHLLNSAVNVPTTYQVMGYFVSAIDAIKLLLFQSVIVHWLMTEAKTPINLFYINILNLVVIV